NWKCILQCEIKQYVGLRCFNIILLHNKMGSFTQHWFINLYSKVYHNNSLRYNHIESEWLYYLTVVKYFALIGQHTCPKITMKEMEALYEVFQKVRNKWKTENVMFLGDLNAACSYVTNKGLKNVCLRSDPKFHWLIRDEQDTTVCEKTCCTYDKLISGIVPESALEVSDHYPVEVDLKANHRYLLRQRYE
uniref:Deoxyribonuclease I-like 1-like n=1 Tax=Cyprinus carpio TaxID=7962 RepID=A0A8C1KV37_CYPCA